MSDVGRHVHPFITPDDCDAVEAIIRRRAGLGEGGEERRTGPVV